MVPFDVCFRQTRDDDAVAESNAIIAISKTLSALNDPAARLRVLRWANERFNAPGATAAQGPAAAATGTADPMLSLDGLHGFFEPAPPRRETDTTPHHRAHAEIGYLFEEPVVRGRTEMRVVARKEVAPAPTASDDLRDLFDVSFDEEHPELEATGGDLYEDAAAHAQAELDDAFGDLYDEPVMQYYAVVDEPVGIVYQEPVAALDEEPAGEPVAQVHAAAGAEQPLDALVADFADALRALTLQLQDASA